MLTPNGRALSNTEHNWCRAVSSGTGITVLALQMTKLPSKTSLLHNILHKLQTSHPVLQSKLHYNPITKDFSFHTPTTQLVNIKFLDIPSTKQLLQTLSTNQDPNLSSLNLILEHELNNKDWTNPNSFPCNGIDLLFARVYELSDTKFVVVLRFHAAICDRTTGVSLLMELMELVAENESGGTRTGIKNEGEGKMGIESMIPSGMRKKTIWALGMDMLGYSVNSFRLSNLKFNNAKWPRSSEVVRLHLNIQHTARILDECKFRGIKLCGALSAAGLIAAHSTKLHSDKLKKKYGVVTLTDCRSVLEPSLPSHLFGFYHSAILNIHTMKGSENLWDLAKTCYTDFIHYKKCNKHFTDMANLNYLMTKAIENPSLTPSSSLRTALISVFEDPVFDNSHQMQQKIGVEDYMGCASVHGVGPSIGIFDIVRDGELDCVCVYPSPLHSREQMNDLMDHMKRVLIDGSD
ncbi:hypothetical protein BUALT_Bualt11G0095900 [Buddleja alternifolia]|uniref:Alcohol acetyltransferase n=1 Tax=Buddleja alternifolia TaxID=168488 RepID=A0AAV6X119_9LAMI|nr:hypothetical protein BUALT_Bualt11G0095900 [Buddleja alternifolia]